MHKLLQCARVLRRQQLSAPRAHICAWLVFAGLLVLCSAPANAQQAAALRLNQLQYIGSHNSYHAGLAPGEATVWKRTDPATFAMIDYAHPSLSRQLDDGVRQLELDVYGDAKGGRYAHPAIVGQVRAAGLPPDPPFADPAVMQRPGFKVMHIQDIDQRSNCQPFTACLAEIRTWSNAHPRHLPLFILVETVRSKLSLPFPTVTMEPFDRRALDALDAEIRSVFAPGQYLSPDDVRGRFRTLNQAIRAQGWPTLEAARGKVIFLLDQRWVGAAYLQGHPSLRGRVLFTNAVPGTDDAAFTELNDGDADSIARLVRQGYLVRTRADADLKEPPRNDTRRRDAMIASGAQLISTDYPFAEAAASGYSVSFPGHLIARCNPLFARALCSQADLSP
ncbi:phosphatidylinositol-specific phospholipase C1-like protein [Dyella acidiphila]|uniref:Phosphatidylinositol-specific phospholipase C1-like protein n=1 Tax=Dyella acidiphila TaxID=2775866 RepID=A0ABR9G9E8_9GAMM|nr:phosphatidylinositol-specific phospholipase C1-like protein [Dyella acidiphila]MBE1160661.1 phosphatidylinositol-specific phospholipase C1-like protein [Dyella acidiphila]